MPSDEAAQKAAAGASASAANNFSIRAQDFIYMQILLFNCDRFVADLWKLRRDIETSL
jgi:hypothetical protein